MHSESTDFTTIKSAFQSCLDREIPLLHNVEEICLLAVGE